MGSLYLVFGFCLGLFHGMASYRFVTSCVCVTHDVCVVLGSSLVFLAFLLCGDRKKRLSCLFYHNRKVIDGKLSLLMWSRETAVFLHTAEAVHNERGIAGRAEVEEMWLEGVANAGEVGSDGTWFNVVGHESDEKAECIWGRFNGEIVEFAEAKVGLKVRVIISVNSGKLYRVAKCDSLLMKELSWHQAVRAGCQFCVRG